MVAVRNAGFFSWDFCGLLGNGPHAGGVLRCGGRSMRRYRVYLITAMVVALPSGALARGVSGEVAVKAFGPIFMWSW